MFLLIEKVMWQKRSVKMVCNALFASWLEHNPNNLSIYSITCNIKSILCYIIIMTIWK
jgi:hypothetical protein